MTIQEVQRQMKAEPFEPFRILTADGRHPEHLALSGKGRLIAVGMDDDSFATLDLLLVTAIRKPIPQEDAARTVG